MADHIVKAYDDELEALGRKIAQMGGVAETMLSEAIEALDTSDAALANKVVSSDLQLDGLQREIEEAAVLTLAKRQPMAIDLRAIIVALRVSGDLERVGDLAKNIATRSMAISKDAGLARALVGIRHMGDLAGRQLKDVLDAYAQQDADRAREVWGCDVTLDAAEDSVFRDLLTFMMEDPRNISFCTDLLFCSKNIERIGDHATNIAEHVVYAVTGETLPLNRPKGRTRTSDRAGAGGPAASPAG